MLPSLWVMGCSLGTLSAGSACCALRFASRCSRRLRNCARWASACAFLGVSRAAACHAGTEGHMTGVVCHLNMAQLPMQGELRPLAS